MVRSRRPSPHTVGCIGLGELGIVIASNLHEKGFDLVGYRRSSMATFCALGGRAGKSPADVMAQADVVVTCLPSAAALEEVFHGPEGLLAAADPAPAVIDITTAPLDVKHRLEQALAQKGIAMLDCPISGRPGVVRRREAPMFVSGEAEAVRFCRPVIEAISRPVYLGPFGAGTKMKFIANILVAIHVMAAAEATEIGARAGFSVQNILDALGQSAATSAQLHIRAPALAGTAPGVSSSASATFLQDMRVIERFVADIGGVSPLFSETLSYWEQASASDFRGRDSAVILTSVLRAAAAAKETSQ